MMNQPTIREQWRALRDVAPGLSNIIFLSLVVAIGHLWWGRAHGAGALESVGLFGPWFSPWLIAIMTGIRLSLDGPAIDARANELRKQRQRRIYGSKY